MFKTLVTVAILVSRHLDGSSATTANEPQEQSSLQELGIALFDLLMFACASDHGYAYGIRSEQQMDEFAALAKRGGFDCERDAPLIYQKDDAALGRLFQLSLKFDRLDPMARCYGNVVFATVLNYGEAFGLERYGEVLSRQPAEVQQRVRDFAYYPILKQSPAKREAEEKHVRERYPTLFPASYQFGKNNPIFSQSGAAP